MARALSKYSPMPNYTLKITLLTSWGIISAAKLSSENNKFDCCLLVIRTDDS